MAQNTEPCGSEPAREGRTAVYQINRGDFIREQARSHIKAKPASDRFQLGVTEHQPLAAFAEVHLHPRLSPGAFEVQDHAIAKH